MSFISNVLDSIPVVGQSKAFVHAAFGDKEGADRAMERSTRATCAVAGVVGGAVAGGPVGAVAGNAAVTAAGDAVVDAAKKGRK